MLTNSEPASPAGPHTNVPAGRRYRSHALRLLAGALLVVSATAACGSAAPAPPAPESTGTSASGPPAPSTPVWPTAVPGNAIALSVLSLKGPSDPPGPAAATSLVDLINTLRAEQQGKALACPGSCWGDARISGPTLLLAVRLGTEACYKVARAYAVPRGDVSKLVVDIDADYLCDGGGGGGTRARASLVLLGVPVSRIPAHGATSIDVEMATSPDSGFTSLGTAGVLIP